VGDGEEMCEKNNVNPQQSSSAPSPTGVEADKFGGGGAKSGGKKRRNVDRGKGGRKRKEKVNKRGGEDRKKQ